MKILIACEFSGIVRDAFTKAGHEAMSCDLIQTETPGSHYIGDVRDLLARPWDMMIAFPPCTHLAVSGARSFSRKHKLQEEAVNFVKELMSANIKKIAIENPIGILSSRIRKPDQIINPYYFGDPVPKKTCLWLKNLPLLQWFPKASLFSSGFCDPEYVLYKSKKSKTGYSKYSIYGRLGKGHGKERSIIFPGIATAMVKQWT